MHCSRVQDLLSAYCDYQLTGAEMLQVSEHLEGCPACQREHASLKQVRALLRSLPPVEADRPFDPRALDAQPRLRFDLPDWYYDTLERVRLATLGFRRAACHLATGATLGLSILAVSALQSPPSRDAARALLPTDISPVPAELAAPPAVDVTAAPQLVPVIYSAAERSAYPAHNHRTVQVIPGYVEERGFHTVRPAGMYLELNGYPASRAELPPGGFGLYR